MFQQFYFARFRRCVQHMHVWTCHAVNVALGVFYAYFVAIRDSIYWPDESIHRKCCVIIYRYRVYRWGKLPKIKWREEIYDVEVKSTTWGALESQKWQKILKFYVSIEREFEGEILPQKTFLIFEVGSRLLVRKSSNSVFYLKSPKRKSSNIERN